MIQKAKLEPSVVEMRSRQQLNQKGDLKIGTHLDNNAVKQVQQ